MRTRRTQNSYFESVTQQISSLSTEQCLIGVKNSVKHRTKQRLQKSSRRQSKLWRSETTRSKCSSAHSKGWPAGIGKPNARHSSNIWKTGCGNPIRKSLWCRGILGTSLCGYAIQNYPWRRWWFWRSNTSMQWIHTSSRTNKFQNLRGDPRKYDCCTSSSSSHGNFSWQLWNRNSDSFHGYSRSNLLGYHMPRKEPIRREFTSPRSRTKPQEFWIVVRKFYRKIQRTLFSRDGVIFCKHRETDCDANWEISWRHRRNPCESGRGTNGTSGQLFRGVHSCWSQEVERHSRL